MAGEKQPGSAVFDAMPQSTARTLRWDLKAAGIAYRDASDRVFDFHALRGAFISRVERSGATVKTLQGLARHSDPRLTLKRYARLRIEDEVATLEAMPGLDGNVPETDAQAARATGTHDPKPWGATPVEAPTPARNHAIQCDDAQHSPLRLAGRDERNPLQCNAKRDDARADASGSDKYPVRDLNPCRRRERAMS